MKYVIVTALLLAATQAGAQQQPSPMETALGQKLMAEINVGLQCGAALTAINQEVAKAQARIKELEDKYESKK